MESVDCRILIVDDERHICELLSELVSRDGYTPLVADSGEAALRIVEDQRPDVMLSDYNMPGMNGMALLEHVKQLDTSLPFIMITAFADVPDAVAAMKAGAYDYLAKPFDHDEVLLTIRQALREGQHGREVFRRPEGQTRSLREMMGPSGAIGRVISMVQRVAVSDFSVVIVGETGSGKELIAEGIHQASPRAKRPFIPVDCGAIPEALLESELFGYEKGAFTGADRQKQGKFEAAQGGTLFLDEISNLPLASQAKLLRVLQAKILYRVGSSDPQEVDVRLVAATNRDLVAAVEAGTFRRDLYFRLNEFTIKIPALRERKEDIVYLAKRFVDATNRELSKQVRGLSQSAAEALIKYAWPGNVRQLRSTIRRAVLLAEDVIVPEQLDLRPMPEPASASASLDERSWEGRSLKEIVQSASAAVERDVVSEALRKSGGNKAKAARMLHIDNKTIHAKIRRYAVSLDEESHDGKAL